VWWAFVCGTPGDGVAQVFTWYAATANDAKRPHPLPTSYLRSPRCSGPPPRRTHSPQYARCNAGVRVTCRVALTAPARLPWPVLQRCRPATLAAGYGRLPRVTETPPRLPTGTSY